MDSNSKQAKKEAGKKMSEVRKQVGQILGAAQDNQLSTFNEFLDVFAKEHLDEDRRTHGVSDDAASDDEDYPADHFGEGKKKPSKEERLASYRLDAVRHFKDGNGRTALHFAASTGAVDVMRTIRDLDSTLHTAQDDHGATPLILAAGASSHDAANNACKVLLDEFKADASAADKSGVMSIHHAAAAGHTQVIEMVVSHGCSLNTASGAGTPLHWAAGEGEHRAVETLVKLGASVDATNSQGLTPIIMAAAYGSSKCVAALARGGADVGHLLSGALTVLHICADTGLTEAVEAILETETGQRCAKMANEHGHKPIDMAAAEKHQSIVQLLLPHSFEGQSPSLEEIMAAGEAQAKAIAEEVEHAKASASGGGDDTSDWVENTSPAVSKEAAAQAQSFKDEGNQAFKARQFADAASHYTEAIKLDGTDATFWSNRSACWLELDQPQRALSDSEQCRKLRPDWPKACFRMASARLALKMYEDAALAAFEGLKLDDKNTALKELMNKAVQLGREEHQASLSSS